MARRWRGQRACSAASLHRATRRTHHLLGRLNSSNQKHHQSETKKRSSSRPVADLELQTEAAAGSCVSCNGSVTTRCMFLSFRTNFSASRVHFLPSTSRPRAVASLGSPVHEEDMESLEAPPAAPTEGATATATTLPLPEGLPPPSKLPHVELSWRQTSSFAASNRLPTMDSYFARQLKFHAYHGRVRGAWRVGTAVSHTPAHDRRKSQGQAGGRPTGVRTLQFTDIALASPSLAFTPRLANL